MTESIDHLREALARVDAHQQHKQEACEALVRCVAEEFPVGTRLIVRKAGHLLEIEVAGHMDSWWSTAGQIFGRNLRTGKHRKFLPHEIVGLLEGGDHD